MEDRFRALYKYINGEIKTNSNLLLNGLFADINGYKYLSGKHAQYLIVLKSIEGDEISYFDIPSRVNKLTLDVEDYVLKGNVSSIEGFKDCLGRLDCTREITEYVEREINIHNG